MTDAISRSEKRFWSKVNKTDTCWLWTGSTSGKGADAYGKFLSIPPHRAAHRLAYSLLAGDIPEGLVLDHLCRVRLGYAFCPHCGTSFRSAPVEGRE